MAFLCILQGGWHVGVAHTATPAQGGGAASPMASPSGQTIAVTLSEFNVIAAQSRYKVGQAYRFSITNAGQTEHEFVIEPRGARHQPLMEGVAMAMAEDIAPGTSATLTWTFTKPGQYQLACHEPGHYEAGQVLPIEVAA